MISILIPKVPAPKILGMVHVVKTKKMGVIGSVSIPKPQNVSTNLLPTIPDLVPIPTICSSIVRSSTFGVV